MGHISKVKELLEKERLFLREVTKREIEIIEKVTKNCPLCKIGVQKSCRKIEDPMEDEKE